MLIYCNFDAAILVGASTGVYLLLDYAAVAITNTAAAAGLGSATTLQLSNYGYSYWISWACVGALFLGGIWMCCASCNIKKQSVILKIQLLLKWHNQLNKMFSV